MAPAALSPTLEHAGLTSAEAREKLRQGGPNTLPRAPAAPVWREILSQLTHFFAVLLWIAGTLAIVAGMLELGVAIFLVVLVNGLFAFAQERRAEHAAQKLGQLLPKRAVVQRDGSLVEIDTSELVEGDLVALSAGDRISADLQVLDSHGLMVDSSLLSGESVALAAGAGDRVFAGSFVVEGDALCRSVSTGPRTRLSQIAALTQGGRRPRTPLARELDRLVRVVALLAAGVGLAFFGVGSALGLPMREGFLLAIGVAVALVPEGLLPSVTLSLATGASRMARHGALVRRLEAVETLGSTTFICSDKTGTLTSNRMNALEVWTPAGSGSVRGNGYEPRASLEFEPSARTAASELAVAAVRCSTGRVLERNGEWVARGDPMEAALHALALRLGSDVATHERLHPELTRFAFDPHRRRMSVVTVDRAYVKGAPDSVLPICVNGGLHLGKAQAMAERGLRVIAVATRSLAATTPRPSLAETENELELLGLVGLLDPPRPEVRGALAACHAAGLRVAMITGDHAETARAVALEVGLRADRVVSGDELPEDEVALGELLDHDGVVACRVSPEQKLAIARALQRRGHVVAMTGDGVNDGPALRQADIGIAMGRAGTDVAREAADLVLLDDRFETIVLAIEQGRSTFSNIRRFLTYHLTDNVAELAPFLTWALSGGRVPLALGVLQILCLDLLTDQFPALALGTERPGPHTLTRAPSRRHLVDGALLRRAFGVLGPTEAAATMTAFASVLYASGWHPGQEPPAAALLARASGTAFAAILFGQMATALACRSASTPAWRVNLLGNRPLLAALLVSASLVALLLYVPPLARLLAQAPPNTLGWALAVLAFPLVLAVDALHKLWLQRAARTRRQAPGAAISA